MEKWAKNGQKGQNSQPLSPGRIVAARNALHDDDKTYRVTKSTSLDAFLQWSTLMTSSPSTTFNAQHGSVPVKGRKVCSGVVKHTLNALIRMDGLTTGESALRCATVTSLMMQLEKKSKKPQSAVAFDVAEVLPRWHEAIFAKEYQGRTNPFNTAIQRMEVHAMFMTSLACCARRSLFTTFSPRRDQVMFSKEMDADGIPNYYKIRLKRWKGNPDENNRRNQTLLIRRNKLNVRFCPVIAMVLWLKTLHDVAPDDMNGPLFPALTRSHNMFERDDEGNMERTDCSTWGVWWNNATKYVGNGLEKCSSHAIRRSVVKWAARCDAKENDVIEAGRWVGNSQHFHVY